MSSEMTLSALNLETDALHFWMAIVISWQGTWEEGHFCGTPDFASTDALNSKRSGAKDDCESLCYTLLQLWNGTTILVKVSNLTEKVKL